MSEMHDPAHPGEIVREAINAEGWTIRDAAERLGVARVTLQRVLNCRASVSPRMALSLERIGWSNAAFWIRLQGQYDLAKARRDASSPLELEPA